MTLEWDEAEIVMISALQHFVYCPRQAALIHVEQVFDENIFTLKGRLLHERADEPGAETAEYGVRVERAVPLWSEKLGLMGKADVVEFHAGGVPFPVEYKRGSRKRRLADDVQVCAQALCLEEMLGVPVPRGAIFHHASRRRREVVFDEELRGETLRAIEGVRRVLKSSVLPPPVNDKRCKDCSLANACMPAVIQGNAGQWREVFVPCAFEEDS